jgi:DNA polymerase-3 subunit epsilon
LSKQKKFKEVKKEFLEFINGKTLIIHNAEFDITHLDNELSLCDEKKISNKIVDTLVLARDKFPGSQVSLDALCKRYRIDNSQRIKHNALLDCDLLAKVYINLIDQKEPTLNFQNHISEISNEKNKSLSYFKKIIAPNDEELIKHEQYLKNFLKKNNF